MSAFVVSPKHIRALAQAVQGARCARETVYEVADILWDENVASVCHRYSEDAALYPKPEWTFGLPVPYSDVQILKAINCYEYQSCEHPGWQDSKARSICAALTAAVIHRLPGYSNAKWEIE